VPLATITPDDARSGRPAALPLIAHRMRAGISPIHTWPDGALHNLRSTLTCAVVNTSAVAAPVCQASFSERDFRNALGQFATGVTVVTTADAQGNPVGMTVSSFNSVSLDPALVLWSIARSSGSFAAFAQSSHYAIHVLASHHKALAFQFAQRGIDRFAGVEWSANAQGVPLLADALATFECRARSQYPEGDHLIMVGEVLACHHSANAAPLLYHAGQMR
jgi:flavin reductase (DIM6/NTAB) family NADH-FMN oxidoreductase RutF